MTLQKNRQTDRPPIKVMIKIHAFTENSAPSIARNSGCVLKSGIPPSSVPAGIAELFPSSFVNLTWHEISNICIRVAKCRYLNNFSFHFLINLHITTYPNPIHSRQIFTALLNMIAVSPRLTPYIIITAATQRPNTCTAILLFLLIQIILYMLFVFFYLRTYNSFSYNFSVFINKYCCRNAASVAEHVQRYVLLAHRPLMKALKNVKNVIFATTWSKMAKIRHVWMSAMPEHLISVNWTIWKQNTLVQSLSVVRQKQVHWSSRNLFISAKISCKAYYKNAHISYWGLSVFTISSTIPFTAL